MTQPDLRRCALLHALIAGSLLAIAGLSWSATGTTAGASPGSASSATGGAGAPPVAAHATAAAPKAPAAKASAPAPAPLIDINGAGRKQLAALPGLSDAQIDKLVASRPYLSKAELVTKGVIPEGTYLSIKGLIIAKQPPQPKAKAKAG